MNIYMYTHDLFVELKHMIFGELQIFWGNREFVLEKWTCIKMKKQTSGTCASII